MQAALRKADEAIAAWEPVPTEAEYAAAQAECNANPSACRSTPEELAADDARNDRLMAADVAAHDAARTTPCRNIADVLAAIDFVVRDDMGDLDETASDLLSRCADFLRGEVSRGGEGASRGVGRPAG
jgi:hypothetical protein